MSKKSVTRLLLICFLALAACFAVCTVSAEAASKTVKVTLKKEIKTKKKTVDTGDKLRLKLTYKNVVLSNEAVSFNSSQAGVASVSGSGIITAKKAGTTVVTAMYKKYGVKIRLTVNASEEEVYTSQAQILPDDVIAWSDWVDSVDSDDSSSSEETENPLRTRIVNYAKSFVGVLPYVYAGNSLKSGTDCSGFIHLIMAHFGISTPRSASEFQRMTNIDYDDLRPGDVVCYKYGGHVALYIGDDRVVHAKGSNYGTVEDSMWYGTPTGYVRFIKD